jgi:hypothetical protein
VREGDKNIRAALTLAADKTAVAPPAPAPSTTPNEPPEESSSGGSIAPWIIGGSGLAVGAVGALLGVVVLGKHSTYEERCVNGCDGVALDARESGEGLAPVSTTLILVGAAAVGVGLVWIITEDRGGIGDAGAEVRTGPVFGTGGAGWRVGGSF